MSLPEVELDDVRFQELVNQSRARIAEHCKEWTEVNVSDPGITLVELFAWMTDMLCYRINRLPEKVHVALLSLLGVKLLPARAATCELCFRLQGPAKTEVRIERGTEVATRRTPTEESKVFQTIVEYTIEPVRPQACLFQREGKEVDVVVSAGFARPAGPDQFAFAKKPRPSDCMLLGFDEPLDRLLVRVEVECEPARGTGVEPADPPLVWEVFAAVGNFEDSTRQGASSKVTEGEWSQVTSSDDSTKGFNKQAGSIDLQMPARTARRQIGSYCLYWLRCRVVKQDDAYSSPPLILSLTAAPVGATIPAEHSRLVEAESLGLSDGTPGESFRLRHAPVLAPAEDEGLQMREPKSAYWETWTRVDTFADSTAQDHHYMLDETAGEVELGPVVRRADSSFRRFGAVIKQGSEVRFSKYRYGGGSEGNAVAETLTHLRRPIPRVASVTNPRAASGGVDGESVVAAGERTAIELRIPQRAVTRADFERLCVEADERVARALCLSAKDGKPTRVHVLARVDAPARPLTLAERIPADELLQRVAHYLEERRLVGTTIEVLPPRYRVVRVAVRVLAGPAVDGTDLERRILAALYRYLNAVVGGSMQEGEPGWRFGRALERRELHPVVLAVDGVREVDFVRVYEEDRASEQSLAVEIDGDLELAPDEVIASGAHSVLVDVPQGPQVQAHPRA